MSEVTVSNELQENINEVDGKYLTFLTDNQLYGIAIADVVQIVGIQDITPVPEFPHYAKGIINLRGSIITVVDMRLRLGKQDNIYDERTCIIVTLIKDVVVGFIVDAVDAVTEIDEANISPPPEGGDLSSSFLTGIAKHKGKIVLLMNIVKVLSEDILNSFSSAY